MVRYMLLALYGTNAVRLVPAIVVAHPSLRDSHSRGPGPGSKGNKGLEPALFHYLLLVAAGGNQVAMCSRNPKAFRVGRPEGGTTRRASERKHFAFQ
jgi:hypothetical protein